MAKTEGTKPLNLWQKLILVKERVPYLEKNKSGHQYKYSTPELVLGTINPILNDLGIFVKTEVITDQVKWERVTYQTYKGDKTETLYNVPMQITFINADAPEEREVMPWFGSGINGEEKGFGSALTYGERYFFLKIFNIPTGEDDPDSFQNRYGDAPQQTSARNGQTRQGAGSPPPAPANKLDDVLPPEPPEVSKENQAILDGLNEFFSTSNLTGIKKLMALERKDKAAKVDLIKWYCYFAGDATQPGAIEVLKKASEYKSSSIETFEALAKASDGRVGATYKEAKKALYNHLRKLKGFEDEPGK